MKKFLFTILAVIPLTALADITIINNADIYGTGKLGFSPCSSVAGDKGIIQPHQSLVVSQHILSIFCGSSCEAQVYATKNCTGKVIATATIDAKKGVTSIQNFDQDNLNITGSGSTLQIDPVANGIFSWFKSWL